MTAKGAPAILQAVLQQAVQPYEWEVTVDNLDGKLEHWIIHTIVTHAVSRLLEIQRKSLQK